MVRMFAVVTVLGLLTTPAHLHAQVPERSRRFVAAEPPSRLLARLAPPIPGAVDPARTALGTVVGMAAGVGIAAVILWTAPGIPGCCRDWQAYLLLVPIAVMPAFGAHDGSGRRGRLPITIAASSSVVGAAYFALSSRASGDRNELALFGLLQFTVTTLAELMTADALAPRRPSR